MANSDLEKRVAAIEARNRKVELDKAWEVSFFRKASVAALTYVVIVNFMVFSNIEKPYLNAIVPSLGFLLSTLTVSYLKKLWISKQ